MAGFMYEAKGDIRSGPSANLGTQNGLSRDIFRVHRWNIKVLAGVATNNDNEDYKLFAKKIKLPEVEFEEESYAGLGAHYKYAANPKFKDVTVDFYDIDGLYPKLHALRDKIWTPQTGVKPAVEYKADTIFVLESPEQNWLEFKLIGSFIKGLSHSDLTYEGKDFKSISLIISYDYFTYSEVKNPFVDKIKKQDLRTFLRGFGAPV